MMVCMRWLPYKDLQFLTKSDITRVHELTLIKKT